MPTNLSPSQQTQKLLEQAQRLADEKAWKEYLEEQERFRRVRFDPYEKFDNWTHGKPGTYSGGCRCEQCKQAWRVYMKEYNKKKREANPLPKKEPKGRAGRVVKPQMHGTQTGYSYGCRCDKCKEAHREARPKSNTKHGTEYAYRHKKCRCRACVKAAAVARKRRIEKKVKKDE